MKAACESRPVADVKLLVVGATGAIDAVGAAALPDLLRRGDLVVVNDAATLPASLDARTAIGEVVEIRLASAVRPGSGSLRFTAALLGRGDHRTPTEHRAPPPPVAPGDDLSVGAELTAHVVSRSAISPRLVEVALTHRRGDRARTWEAIYRSGKPVQYAHVARGLDLWEVQNVWADRPWAVEMPSAGRALRGETLSALRLRGVAIAAVTHAAGLSATGDPAIDARLPLPERFEVPAVTVQAIEAARARGGRVVAVGTSVVRALESAGRGGLRATSGITSLRLGPGSRLAVVDALLTGVHASDTTHFALLGAFASTPVLAAALRAAKDAGFLGHELGDVWLVWRDRQRAASATFAA